jgi:hypothetical protein
VTVYKGQDIPGIIYLIHFDTPLHHAKHYTGWTTDLAARLADHAAGRGARLMQVIREQGITWQLAKVVHGTRVNERSRKGTGASRWCPVCKGGEPEFAEGVAIPDLTAILGATVGARS